MEYTISKPFAGVIVLALIGRLDSNGSSSLQSGLSEASDEKPQLIVLDMSGVNQLSSSGIRAILSSAKEIKTRGGKLVIACAQQQVEYSLTMSGVDTQVPIFSSLEKAYSAGL